MLRRISVCIILLAIALVTFFLFQDVSQSLSDLDRPDQSDTSSQSAVASFEGQQNGVDPKVQGHETDMAPSAPQTALSKQPEADDRSDARLFDLSWHRDRLDSLSAAEKSNLIKMKSRFILPTPVQDIVPGPQWEGEMYVTLNQSPVPLNKESLRNSGLVLLDHVTRSTWRALITDASCYKTLDFITAAAPVMPEDKLSLGLWNNLKTNQEDMTQVYIGFIDSADRDVIEDVLVDYQADFNLDSAHNRKLFAALSTDSILALADQPQVRHIDLPPPADTINNVNAAALSDVDDIQSAPYNLTGTNINVMVRDGGSIALHSDFGSPTRITIVDSTTYSEHATHVAGTIGGSGAGNSSAKGMAVETHIYSYTYGGSAAPEMEDANTTYGVRLSNHSYGHTIGWNDSTWNSNTNLFGDYSTYSDDWDEVIRNLDLIVMKSAGNDRNDDGTGNPHDGTLGGDGDYYDCMEDRACAKNVMAVGAVTDSGAMTSFSNYGPCDDGRIKPDIVANGYAMTSTISTDTYGSKSGTSMSSPTMCGMTALLMEQYADSNSGADLPADLCKALYINTAEDLGRTGPDYAFGWGLAKAQAAADVIRNYDSITNRLYIMDTATENITNSYQLYIPSSMDTVTVTIVWMDEPGNPSVVDALVNDINISLVEPNGSTTHDPFVMPFASGTGNFTNEAVTGVNEWDNIEQIKVANPTAGFWTLNVEGYNMPGYTQDFAVVTSEGSIFYDDASILLSTNELVVPEGGTNTFAIHLSAEPIAAKTVSVTRISGDTDLSVSAGATLTFTTSNWDQSQFVTLAAGEDADAVAGSAEFEISSPGSANESLTAYEQENELGIQLSPTSLTIAEGNSDTFDMRLTMQPASTITVLVSRTSGHTNITVASGSPAAFTTVNWDQWQTITLDVSPDTDTTNNTAIFTCSAPGVPDATITVTADDIPKAYLPFTETFESGSLSNFWSTYSTGAGRILQTSDDSPYAGSYHLTMDSSTNAVYGLNELILNINLAGQTNVTLSFWHKEFGDEDNEMSSSFIGHEESDGVAVSTDGTNWYKAQGLISTDGIGSSYTQFEVNLDAVVSANSLTYNSDFKIRFQQYDNYGIGTDGFAFDNITISSPTDSEAPSAPTGLTAQSATTNSITIRWNASTDNIEVTGYAIYRDGSIVDTTSSTQYQHTGLSPNTAYGTYVAAYDAAGNTSAPCSSITVTTAMETVATPAIAPNGGTFYAPAVATVSCATAGSSIYYTTDGSDPSESSSSYSIPLTITNTLTLKAKAYKTGMNPSAIASASFTIQDPTSLITNGSFEAGGSTPTSWGSAGGCLGVRTNTQSFMGEWAVMFDGDQADDGYFQQPINLKSSTVYTLSYWVKTENITSSGIYLRYVQLTPSVIIYGTSRINGSTDWTYISRTFTTSASIATGRLDIHGGSQTNGTTWVDHVDLREGTGMETVSDITITPAGGIYTDSVDIALSGDAGVEIRYTTNGTAPTFESALYSTPISLTESATVQARGFKTNMVPGSVTSATFTVQSSSTWTLTGIAGPNGSISPTSAVVIHGGSTNFIITPDTYYFITNLTVNGVGQTPVENYVWTNVTADGTVTVAFAESVAANNQTPHWWLAQNGLTNSGISFDEAETNDFDGDGFTAWEEFIAGTQPTNAGSFLQIDDVDALISANGNVIQWQGLNTNAQYTIMWTTNLANELEALGSPQTPAAPAAQLIMTDSVHQTEGRIYYQLKVDPLP